MPTNPKGARAWGYKAERQRQGIVDSADEIINLVRKAQTATNPHLLQVHLATIRAEAEYIGRLAAEARLGITSEERDEP